MLLCLVASSAGGVAERLRPELVEPALRRGWRVAITLTPTAALWLDAVGESDRLRALTDLPVRSVGRMPDERSPYGLADRYLFAPATATSIAKLALGIGDNQALTQLCEAVGADVPMVVHPQAGAPQRAHPAFAGYLDVLRSAGVVIADGPSEAPWEPLLDLLETSPTRRR